MMNAIQIRGLSKCFKIPPSGWVGLAKKVRFLLGSSTGDKIWAVKDLDLSVKEGECLGIIGKNGSGKTTLLKLIAGILKPTEGEIKVNGKVSLIHELGSGFDSELTGKENLFLYGAIAGLSDKEINKKLKEITEFSGLGEFINLKLKTYSSGMIVRLAFAAVAVTNPSILLIDEALSVGDLAFQKKSLMKIKEYKQSGKTMVIVSHYPQSLMHLCDRCLLIHDGRKIYCGDPAESFKRYVEIFYDEYRDWKDVGLLAEFLKIALEIRDYVKDETKMTKLINDLKAVSVKGANLLKGAETDVNTISLFAYTFWYLDSIDQFKSIKEYESYEKVIKCLLRCLLNTSLAKEYNKELLFVAWKKFRLYPSKKRREKLKVLRETFMQCLSFTKNDKEKINIINHHKAMLKEELNLTKHPTTKISENRFLKKIYKNELLSLRGLN